MKRVVRVFTIWVLLVSLSVKAAFILLAPIAIQSPVAAMMGLTAAAAAFGVISQNQKLSLDARISNQNPSEEEFLLIEEQQQNDFSLLLKKNFSKMNTNNAMRKEKLIIVHSHLKNAVNIVSNKLNKIELEQELIYRANFQK